VRSSRYIQIYNRSFSVVVSVKYQFVKRWQNVSAFAAVIPRVPLYARLVARVYISVTALILILYLFSRGNSPTLTFSDPPSNLLPGPRQFLTTGSCESIHDGRFYCDLNHNGTNVHVTYDANAQAILYTFVETPDLTLGDLIMAWGAPTRYSRADKLVTVFWGSRAAHLPPNSFEPRSRVLNIGYGDSLQDTQPWRGFVNGGGGR
jgi:hypothetical protein